ncbi:MAG: hypothetical protein HQL36_07900 [Alphaproteobacteria bacterium]|nr:hypothetical protein [Alphaproteobacteria bacterium]MBF0251239.1 hypothetical protein [Alphaproteobacteria bacterium]
MALSAIALCSRALLKTGCRTITSFDEGTAEAEVTGNLYAPVRDAMLSSHPWSFATAQVTLPRLEAQPVADYDFAYQLPADFLRALSAGEGRGRGLDYRIHERRLHTNATEVVLTYIFRPLESEFPPFFDQALIARLSAEFCIPLTDSTSRSAQLLKEAEDEFRRAKSIDAQQDSPRGIEDFTLIGVRS